MSSPSEGELAFATLVKYARLPEPTPEYRFDKVRKWRFDFAWPELLVAAEIEGGHYSGGHKRFGKADSDCEKANAAALQGWLVLRFTPAMLDQDPMDVVTKALRKRQKEVAHAKPTARA